MKLKEYLKTKWLLILLFHLMILLLILLQLALKAPIELIIASSFIIFCFSFIFFLYDYLPKHFFYQTFLSQLEKLDQKYLVIETIKTPNFYEGKILVDALYEINKSMLERIQTSESNMLDFKEYIELWIHEVKLPLATLTLMVHNNKSHYDNKVKEQLKRLDNYLEQVLYYVRSENAEVDYLIKNCSLKKIISNVALKNKDSLLEQKIELIVSDIDHFILTDSKWLEFILNQIIDNSMKYKKKENAYIKIASKEDEDNIYLIIYDNGIGISKADLPRVFEKSFTGKNGRSGTKSTGMGLYIVKKLCRKLGHKIEIKSEEGKCTVVTLTFAKDRYYDVLK